MQPMALLYQSGMTQAQELQLALLPAHLQLKPLLVAQWNWKWVHWTCALCMVLSSESRLQGLPLLRDSCTLK